MFGGAENTVFPEDTHAATAGGSGKQQVLYWRFAFGVWAVKDSRASVTPTIDGEAKQVMGDVHQSLVSMGGYCDCLLALFQQG